MTNLVLIEEETVEEAHESHLVTVDSAMLARFKLDEKALSAYRAEFASLSFDTPSEYAKSSRFLSEVTDLRCGVEGTRKRLKATPLEECRRIDAFAKYITEQLREIEDPLKAKKEKADEAKRLEKAEKERIKREAFEATLRAAQAAEQARIDAERAKLEVEKEEQRKRDAAALAERERIEQEQAAEREKLTKEKAEFEAEKARQREEQETERRKIEAEHRRLAEAREAEERRVAAEREARERIERAKRDTQEKAEREAREAEAARVRAQEQEAARLARIEALKPDAEKLRDYANRVTDAAVLEHAIQFNSEEADVVFAGALGKILAACNELREFGR